MSKEFEIARLLVLQAHRNGQIEDARAFAWANRICPFNPDQLEEPFLVDFEYGPNETDEVLQAVVRLSDPDNNKYPTFNDIESATGIPRIALRDICRLAFFSGQIEGPGWQALTAAGPMETRGMDRPLDPDTDIHV